MRAEDRSLVPGVRASDEAAALLDPWVIFTAPDGERAMRTLDRVELVQRLLDRPDLLVRLAIESGGLRQVGFYVDPLVATDSGYIGLYDGEDAPSFGVPAYAPPLDSDDFPPEQR